MSLSSWFKDYLFYPVLRSDWNVRLRKRFCSKYFASVVPTSVALAVVWVATGLWHGASWGYVGWGVYYGVFMILGIVLAPVYDGWHRLFPTLEKNRLYIVFQMIRTFGIVALGYSIFKPADLVVTAKIWRQMMSGLDGGGVYQLMYTLHHSFIKTFIWIGLMFVVDAIHYSHKKGTIRGWLRRLPILVRWIVYLAGLWLMIFFGLYGSGFDQFEYFKF